MIYQRIRPAAVAAALVVLTAPLATCSSGTSGAKLSKTDPLATVAAAMQRAKSGHTKGTIDTPHQQPTTLSGTWKGNLGTGQLQTDATFITVKGVRLPTQMRVVGNSMYLQRSVADVPSTQSPTFTVFARSARFKPWRNLELQGQIIALLPSAFSPAFVVDWLRKVHVPVRVERGKATHLITTRPLAIGVWLGATVDLALDDRARVVDVNITSPSGGARYAVTNFGAPVSVVPPPAASIETRSELPVKEPAGPFVTVKSGTTNGITWAVQRAPGTAGTVCWRWKATPPLPEAGLKRPGDPRCVTTAGPDPAPEDTITFVVDGNGAGKYDAMAIEVPKGARDTKVGFVGGKVISVPAAPIVVWVGPSDPVKGYFGVTLADGTKIDCGAGAISTQADLTDPTVTNADIGGAAWGCLPHVS